jgi:uncharacterized cupredoxin-like copper-binding protein
LFAINSEWEIIREANLSKQNKNLIPSKDGAFQLFGHIHVTRLPSDINTVLVKEGKSRQYVWARK